MNLKQFRANTQLVGKAATILANPDVQLLIKTLEDSAPRFWANIPMGAVPAHDHSRMLGTMEGYDICLQNLRSLAVLPVPVESPIFETYPATEH